MLDMLCRANRVLVLKRLDSKGYWRKMDGSCSLMLFEMGGQGLDQGWQPVVMRILPEPACCVLWPDVCHDLCFSLLSPLQGRKLVLLQLLSRRDWN